MMNISAIAILLLFLIVPLFLNNNVEGFLPQSLATSNVYPGTETGGLVEDEYPSTGRLGTSNNSASTIWWHYPVFKVGSYAQITNNIKYPNNPDKGNCMPAEFCGALYKEKPHMPSNYAQVLGPVPKSSNARVNYYNTDSNLLPFKIHF